MSHTLRITKDLINKPSVTPDDAGCQIYIANFLKKLGFKINHLPFGSVKNLWATRGSGPIFSFAGHTDVVPAGNLFQWQTSPFKATEKEGKLYGRGAADMKGAIASMLTAIQAFIEKNPSHPGTLAFLITSDEEGSAVDGTKKVVEYLMAQDIFIRWCIIGEPSSHSVLGDNIRVGRRGSLSGNLKVKGLQGHVAYPEKANNPIHNILQPLHILSTLIWDNGNQYFPPSTLQITDIHAGLNTDNIIPDELRCHFNLRYNTELSIEIIQNKIDQLFSQYGIMYTIDWQHHGEPFLALPGNLKAATQDAIQTISQITPTFSTDGGTSDGRFIAKMKGELLELGHLNRTIHQANEYVVINDLDKLSNIYLAILNKLLL